MNAQFEAVASVLSIYFDGLYNSDVAALSRAFHHRAHYVCATDEAFQYLTMAEYFPIVEKRPSPARRSEPRQDRIVSIEFAGPVTAFARVECAIGPKFFTDLLTLVRVDDEWRIISKVFHYESAE